MTASTISPNRDVGGGWADELTLYQPGQIVPLTLLFVHPALGTSYTPEFNKKVYHNEPIKID